MQRPAKGSSTSIASVKIEDATPIKLQDKAEDNNYTFREATGKDEPMKLGETVSVDVLSTNVAGGFTGAMIGLYATSGNDATIQ